eukprot:CAMPEP_0172872326 /NCGR_PEP_ID=MMETSP1075-20121228/92575_1 /TAXON_ID=2916 /ORGANISM="Ceratium fusus, Strain PA161109" /LENGTH=167 /DNA_ID=CAMNT_0013722645 /DNA_START=71 /DNA_END=575 /DNA_ORIENTATION=+
MTTLCLAKPLRGSGSFMTATVVCYNAFLGSGGSMGKAICCGSASSSIAVVTPRTSGYLCAMVGGCSTATSGALGGSWDSPRTMRELREFRPQGHLPLVEAASMQGEAQQVHPPQVAQEALVVLVGAPEVEVGDPGGPAANAAHHHQSCHTALVSGLQALIHSAKMLP